MGHRSEGEDPRLSSIRANVLVLIANPAIFCRDLSRLKAVDHDLCPGESAAHSKDPRFSGALCRTTTVTELYPTTANTIVYEHLAMKTNTTAKITIFWRTSDKHKNTHIL